MAGIWDVKIETFIKAPPMQWIITGPDESLTVTIEGQADQGDMAIADAKLVGSQFTWTLNVTKPLKISTKGTCTVSADGNSFEGTAKAGMLPGGKFFGERRAQQQEETAAPVAEEAPLTPPVYETPAAQPAPPAPSYGSPVPPPMPAYPTSAPAAPAYPSAPAAPAQPVAPTTFP